MLVDGWGVVRYVGPGDPALPAEGLRLLGGTGRWIGPGLVDAHVHLAFGAVEDYLPSGVVAVRDLGAPVDAARGWRTGAGTPPPGRPFVGVSGPILTAPSGYPSYSWGAAGFACFVDSPDAARAAVRRLTADGADVVKVALEPGDAGRPVPQRAVLRAIVEAAHEAGLAVVAHALRVAMVRRAVDAGVDELAHAPTDRLPAELVDRIAAAGVSVVSTLHTFFAVGGGHDPAANVADLHQAGVTVRYGTDLGNLGTCTGADPRELECLAEAGLGRLGALRAATDASARAPGLRGRTGSLAVGERASLVLLARDPLADLQAWRSPLAVIADGRLLVR